MSHKLNLIIAQSSSGEFFSTLIPVLLVMAVMFGVFLIIRELVLWYWKVNTIVNNQEAQLNEQRLTNQLLKQQNDLLKSLVENQAK